MCSWVLWCFLKFGNLLVITKIRGKNTEISHMFGAFLSDMPCQILIQRNSLMCFFLFQVPLRGGKQQPHCKCRGVPRSHKMLLLYPQRELPWQNPLKAEDSTMVFPWLTLEESVKTADSNWSLISLTSWDFANKNISNKLDQKHTDSPQASPNFNMEVFVGGPEFIPVPSSKKDGNCKQTCER